MAGILQVLSGPRANFRAALGDVARLLALHDAETKRQPGRPSPDVEVFKRAGVILSVTAWETFVEDTIVEALDEMLQGSGFDVRLCGEYSSIGLGVRKEITQGY